MAFSDIRPNNLLSKPEGRIVVYLALAIITSLRHYNLEQWVITTVLIGVLVARELDEAKFFDNTNVTKKSLPAGPASMAIAKLNAVFKKALPNEVLVAMVTSLLQDRYGYSKETSLLATSLCCDEVNRDLEKEFNGTFGDNFSMGGLAGFAFGGVTSFGAMAHHIPENGSCLIVYGPHVGIDSDGNVGKINRRGRVKSGACCGSAAAAAGYCSTILKSGNKKNGAAAPSSPLDAQQFFVGNMLLPHAERLDKASEPDVELPLALFDVQDDLMHKIVEKGCQEVGGDGKIALLGGIQINTPSDAPDYFMPLKFEIRNNKGQLLEDLLWE